MSSNHQVHPWHGISAGKNSPSVVTAFIEVVPTDTVKYEIDKVSVSALNITSKPIKPCPKKKIPLK